MEEQCSSWAYYYQEEAVDQLKQSLLYSTLELEAALVSAHDEISRKDDEILQLKSLLASVIKERDEFHAKCNDLALEKQQLILQQQMNIPTETLPISSNNEEDHNNTTDRCTSDCCDDNLNILSDITERVAVKTPLPEQGRFLQAVMAAGPLLHSLLLAGPLPRWQHPPPQLNSVDIPPVVIQSTRIVTRDFSPSPKYQRVCSPPAIINELKN
ncbi:Protein of unknown function (DUF1635 [Striga hermonthica]|uniref:Uncharacterized protein n=1 Tax=Striga hermonthica TaxID=68872 RepID=A0A9N7MW54_STRHE|nr:Protein of unknown function (DUF1635 [Striga hermonthica]